MTHPRVAVIGDGATCGWERDLQVQLTLLGCEPMPGGTPHSASASERGIEPP